MAGAIGGGVGTPTAAVVVVGKAGTGIVDFDNLTAAIAALGADGGVIYVKNGIYAQVATLILTGKPIKIIGSGVDATTISRVASDPIFSMTSDDSFEFQGLTLSAGVGLGGNIFDFSAAVTGTNPCRITDCKVTDGQVFVSSLGTAHVVATRCEVTMGSGSGVRIWSSVAGTIFEATDCLFTEGGNAAGGGITGSPEIRWTNVRYEPGANVLSVAGKVTMVNCKTIGGRWDVNGAESLLSNSSFDSESGTGLSNVVLFPTADDSEVTGCTFKNATTQNLLLSSPTGCVVTGNKGCKVTESGTANRNRYSNNESFDGSTIIGAESVVDDENVRTVTTTPVTLDRDDRTVDVDSSGGNRLLNLPTAASAKPHVFTVKKKGSANTVTIDPAGAETIDGATTLTMTDDEDVVRFQTTGTEWIILSRGATIVAAAVNGPFQFYADQLENPNNADWVVNALAPAQADDNNNGLTVRAFDDTTDEGVGFTLEVPAGVTNMTIRFRGRAQTAPAGVRAVGLQIFNRGIPDNAAVEAFSAPTLLADIVIPTNEFFQYDEQTLTLAGLGVTAGEVTQFELTRTTPGGTNLPGNWLLLELQIEWS